MHRDPYRLYPHDRVLLRTLLPLIPAWVRPNHLTGFRLVVTPVVVVLLLQEQYAWGVPLFVLAALSDMFDGSIARTRKQITSWGVMFDPIADKLLIGSAFLAVAIPYYPPGLLLTMLVLDVLPLMGWMVAEKKRRATMMANGWGKAKMVTQCVAMTALLAGIVFGWPEGILVGEVLLVLAVVLAGVAVVTYSL